MPLMSTCIHKMLTWDLLECRHWPSLPWQECKTDWGSLFATMTCRLRPKSPLPKWSFALSHVHEAFWISFLQYTEVAKKVRMYLGVAASQDASCVVEMSRQCLKIGKTVQWRNTWYTTQSSIVHLAHSQQIQVTQSSLLGHGIGFGGHRHRPQLVGCEGFCTAIVYTLMLSLSFKPGECENPSSLKHVGVRIFVGDLVGLAGAVCKLL